MGAQDQNIKYPFGAATRLAPSFAANLHLAIWNNLTLVVVAVTAAMQIDLTIDPETEDGAELVIRVEQDATGRAVTLGDGFAANDLGITGVANDIDTITAKYNATTGLFEVVSITKVVDAA
ncbi:MAG: hypothetical protein RIC03_06950 [Cyclobacteriaceae bacterium]